MPESPSTLSPINCGSTAPGSEARGAQRATYAPVGNDQLAINRRDHRTDTFVDVLFSPFKEKCMKCTNKKSNPKIEEIRDAVAAFQDAYWRILEALEAIQGSTEGRKLAQAARLGLILTFAYCPMFRDEIEEFDFEPYLTVKSDTNRTVAIADAMFHLAALARYSGLDEKDLFESCKIDHEEFKGPAMSALE